MQVRDSRPVQGFDYSIIRRGRDRRDETRRRLLCLLAAKRYCTRRQGEERSGGGRGREWWDGGEARRGEVRYARFGKTRDGEQDGSTGTNAADCRGGGAAGGGGRRREEEDWRLRGRVW